MSRRSMKLKLAAIVIATLVLSSQYLNLISLAATEINSFYCDAQYTGNYNGHAKYKADVYEIVNFYYSVKDTSSLYAVMGDGKIKWNIPLSPPFSYNYTVEGFYNVTLWAVGAGSASDWIIIEIINDPPEFDIGISLVDCYAASYSFENDTVRSKPAQWSAYRDLSDFYIKNDLPGELSLILGTTLQGSYQDLKIQDNVGWVIQGAAPHDYVSISFDIQNGNGLIKGFRPGKYALYFYADTIMEFGYYGKILFEGSFCNGMIITLESSELRLWMYDPEYDETPDSVKIDWFKLVMIDKGTEINYDTADHGKIVKLESGNQSLSCGIFKTFSQQRYGTVEFWYKTTNPTLGGSFILADTFNLTQENGKWFSGAADITSEVKVLPLSDVWFHIRMDFRDTSSPPYQNLSQGYYRIYINGKPGNSIIMGTGGAGVDVFRIKTNGTIFIDAIGLSWENYAIGTNLNPVYPDHLYTDQGLSFNATNIVDSNFDIQGFLNNTGGSKSNFKYIWDFGEGAFINERSAIHKFANPGVYPVRLTLIDDQGAMKTQMRELTIENKPPSSITSYGVNYDVTYDFKSDINGLPPNGWFTSGNVKVTDLKDGFSKVVEIDTTEEGLGLMSTPERFDSRMMMYGPLYQRSYVMFTIEFWIYFTDITKDQFCFWAEESASEGYYNSSVPSQIQNLRFGVIDGVWSYYYEVFMYQYNYEEIVELEHPKSNEWTHVRCDIDFFTNKWRLIIDGNSSNYYNITEGVSFIDRIGFYTEPDSHIFLDSFGFTTDPNYQIGDNIPHSEKNFYGTWDFRSIPDGYIPYDATLQLSVLGPWVFSANNFKKIAMPSYAKIIPSLDCHTKVLELHDSSSTDLAQASLFDFSKPTYGTIEFWLRTTDISQGIVMAFGYEVFDTGIWLGNDGKWWYKDGANEVEITDVSVMRSNTWHHIRIDFDCRESGGYLGLMENQFSFWVDGNISNLSPFDFSDDVSYFEWNIWSTMEEGHHYSIYLDAIGVSWDPAYEVGDNLVPKDSIYSGTEIIFFAESTDTSSDATNLRYLWDFGDNQTAFGQTITHVYERPGTYKLRLFTLDDSGVSACTEKYLRIENDYPNIDILHNYRGYATFDFSNDKVGESPTGFYSLSANIYNKPIIISELGCFQNVLQLTKMAALGGIITSFNPEYPNQVTLGGNFNQTYGSVEFWLYANTTYSSRIFVNLFDDYHKSDGIYFTFNEIITEIWIAYTDSGWTPITFSDSWKFKSNKWTHFRIDFCTYTSSYMGLANDSYIIYADGHPSQVLKMKHQTSPDIINITSFALYATSGKVYIDNIGFSWDEEYTVGDNRYADLPVQFNEGDTVILECNSYDTNLDYQKLIYNWGPLSMDIEEWNDLGWRYSYTFMDNNDDIGVEGYPLVGFVGDPYFTWDIDTYKTEVMNVLPTLNINNPSIVTNISVAIYNTGLEGANFSIELLAESFNITKYWNYPSDFSDHLLNASLMTIALDPSRNWRLRINQTATEGGQHLFFVKFLYTNGVEFIKSHNFVGATETWTIDLNEMWSDSINNLSKVPIAFNALICDPSNDKIDLSLNSVIRVLYEIDYSGLPYTKTYTIAHQPNDILCKLTIFEDTGNKYAKFEFIEPIQNIWADQLISGNFPVNYGFNFSIDMTEIDIFTIINSIITSENLDLQSSEFLTTYHINASYYELDSISTMQNFRLDFNVSAKFEFNNIAPSITIDAPFHVAEEQTTLCEAEVRDFNGDNVTVKFLFGVNNGDGDIEVIGNSLGGDIYGVNYTYGNEGNYLIKVIASDGKEWSKAMHLIRVENQPPYARIKNYQNVTSKGQPILFEADLYDTESDINSLRVYWDFGDGTQTSEIAPSHAFYHGGDYQVRLIVKDNNGASFVAIHNITVVDSPPEILGPFSFTGTEGHSILLDIDVLESINDCIMNYTWDIYKAIEIYKGFYNFLNLSAGNLPGYPFQGFQVKNNIDYRIVDNVSGHIKVLELRDQNTELGGEWRVKFGNNQSANGTIEFWLRTSYLTPNQTNFYLDLLENGTGIIPILLGDNGTWMMYNNLYYTNQSEIPNLPRLTSQQWHHIRFDYECTTGNYTGLGKNQWRIVVDGVYSPNLNFQLGVPPFNKVSYLDTLEVMSGNVSEISIYCDAIGYYNPLNSNLYHIGDNLNPVLVSYDYVQTIFGEDPSITLDEGTYLANVTVQNGLLAQTSISIYVRPVDPFITVSNRHYYGAPGSINVTAYAWDSLIDSGSLEFEWFVENKRIVDQPGTATSSIEVLCDASGIIIGHVLVRDSLDSTASAEFLITVFIDSNGDGLTNEKEYYYGFNVTDQDGDNLPNIYELEVTHTNTLAWDSDNDGLCDGWDNFTQVGELLLGTDPSNNDTDGDGLLDGFEVFGWNGTIPIQGDISISYYSSDPLTADTDADGVSDKDEVLYKTNPRDPDTDNDLLNDFLEVFIWVTDPREGDIDNDGLVDGIEVSIGTHSDDADTDGDGIEDAAEYYGWNGFKTNPLCKDSDHDFLTDNSEIIPLNSEIEGRKSVEEPVSLEFKENFEKAGEARINFLLTYGESALEPTLSDVNIKIHHQESQLLLFDEDFQMSGTERYISKIVDIKDIFAAAKRSYYGTYIFTVTYLNPNHADLCLEIFDMYVTKYLDPNDNDFDDDGLMDGVETNLLVKGNEQIECPNLINISKDNDSKTFDSYELEISDIGHMNAAAIDFTIASNKTLLGSGSVYVDLIKRELDFRKSDSILLTSNISFSRNDNFLQNYHKDLAGFFPNDYFGKYTINLNILDNESADVFNLTAVTINTEGYRAATESDTNAWVTKPDRRDTDGDGWTDYYELYGRSNPTNPLVWDTDGDGVKDSVDIDPFYDLILEIEFVSGTIGKLPAWYIDMKNPPELQMTVHFMQEGEIKAIASPHTLCSEDQDSVFSLLYTFAGTPILYYYRTAIFDDKYYINLDDRYYATFDMEFCLWDGGVGSTDAFWDTLCASADYKFNTREHQKDVSVSISGDYQGASLEAEVIMRGLSRPNTIAIHSNATIFNGHYNDPDRMNIIQVEVTDTPNAESPFENGINYILIPSRVFINTNLNALLLNPTMLATSILKTANIMSVDRENLPETASNKINSIIEITCSTAVAEQILNLTLWGLINETTNEIGVINQKVSTKLEGFMAEMMNLHPEVLGYLMIKDPYTDSDQGSMPITAGEYWTIMAQLAYQCIVEAWTAFLKGIEIGLEVVMAVGALVVKTMIIAALLILIYIWFAVTILVTAITFWALIPLVSIANGLVGLEIEITGTSFTIKGKQTFTHGFYTSWKYIDFMGLNIPSVVTYNIIEGTTSNHEIYYFASLEEDPAVELYNTLNDLLSEIPVGTSDDFYEGIIFMLCAYGTAMNVAGNALKVTEKSHPEIGLIAAIGTIMVLCIAIVLNPILKMNDGTLTQNYLYGMIFGGIIVAFFNFLVTQVSGDGFKLLKEAKKEIKNFLAAFGVILALFLTPGHMLESKEFKLQDKEVAPLFAGILGLISGTISVGLITTSEIKTNLAYVFAITAIVVPLITFICILLS